MRYTSLALWMSGQTPPNGRRSHITQKKKSASRFHRTCQPTQFKKCRDRDLMAAFTYHLTACVRINLGDTRGHTVDKAYENLTVNCWEMNNEASASVVNGCARKKCKCSM